MTDHRTIIAGRGHKRREVKVERRCAARAEQVRRGVLARIAANDAAAARRDVVHEAGVAAVADALGMAYMLDLGGVMTGARGRALDGRKGVRSGFGGSARKSGKDASAINALDQDLRPEIPDRKSGGCASKPVGKIDMGPPPIVIPAPGRPLLAEISDLFRRSPERCPKPLYETRL